MTTLFNMFHHLFLALCYQACSYILYRHAGLVKTSTLVNSQNNTCIKTRVVFYSIFVICFLFIMAVFVFSFDWTYIILYASVVEDTCKNCIIILSSSVSSSCSLSLWCVKRYGDFILRLSDGIIYKQAANNIRIHWVLIFYTIILDGSCIALYQLVPNFFNFLCFRTRIFANCDASLVILCVCFDYRFGFFSQSGVGYRYLLRIGLTR